MVRITAHPDLDFLVVVNPNSGPGDLPSPNKDYAREVPKLNAFPNVYTVGYIRIHYCDKPLEKVYQEIDRYASWSACDGLGLGGILLDETPNHYSEAREEYLRACTGFIKGNQGILRDRMVSSLLFIFYFSSFLIFSFYNYHSFFLFIWVFLSMGWLRTAADADADADADAG